MRGGEFVVGQRDGLALRPMSPTSGLHHARHSDHHLALHAAASLGSSTSLAVTGGYGGYGGEGGFFGDPGDSAAAPRWRHRRQWA